MRSRSKRASFSISVKSSSNTLPRAPAVLEFWLLPTGAPESVVRGAVAARSVAKRRRISGSFPWGVTGTRADLFLAGVRTVPGNAGGEPVPVGGAEDEQHWVVAGGRHRWRERVVDVEIAVSGEGHAGGARAVSGGRRRGSAEDGCEDALLAGGADRIAGGEQQAPPIDGDAAVRLDFRRKRGDPPGKAARRNAADDVDGGGSRRGHSGDRIDSDAAFEGEHGGIGRGRAGKQDGEGGGERFHAPSR